MAQGGDERSKGGNPILRHQRVEPGWTPAAPSTGAEEIEKHFERHFGEPTWVFHELVSDRVHLDVHIIPPRARRNRWVLFTTGMSDLPMTLPPGVDAPQWAELMISLPAGWKVDSLRATPPPPDLEQWYWPIRWLKQLARLPHEYKTWLGVGHTIPHGDPPKPFASGTQLCCWLLLPPISVPEEAREVRLSDGRVVALLALHALFPEEMQKKLDEGMGPLLDLFDREHVTEVLTPDRKSVLRKRVLGLF